MSIQLIPVPLLKNVAYLNILSLSQRRKIWYDRGRLLSSRAITNVSILISFPIYHTADANQPHNFAAVRYNRFIRSFLAIFFAVLLNFNGTLNAIWLLSGFLVIKTSSLYCKFLFIVDQYRISRAVRYDESLAVH